MPNGSLGRSLTRRESARSEPPMKSPLPDNICKVNIVMKLSFQQQIYFKDLFDFTKDIVTEPTKLVTKLNLQQNIWSDTDFDSWESLALRTFNSLNNWDFNE